MCKYCRQDWRKFKYSFLNLRMLLITERNRASGLEQSLGHSTAFVFSVQRKMVFVKCRLQALGLYISVRDFRKGIYTERHIPEVVYNRNIESPFKKLVHCISSSHTICNYYF